MASPNEYITNSLVRAAITKFLFNQTIFPTAYKIASPYRESLSVGSSYQVRLNSRGKSSRGFTSVTSDIVDRTIDVTVQSPFSYESLFNAADFEQASGVKDGATKEERIIAPGADDISLRVEEDLIAKMDAAVYQAVGTPASSFSTSPVIQEAKVLMKEMLFPNSEKTFLALNSTALSQIGDGFNNNFNQPATNRILSKGWVRNDFYGYDHILCNDVMPSFVSAIPNDIATATLSVNAIEGATTLTIDLGDAVTYEGGVIPKGTCIEFSADNVRSVADPQYVTSRGFQCRATADSTVIALGIATVAITPKIQLAENSAIYAVAKNVVVSGTPPNAVIPLGTSVSLIGTYKANYAYISPGIVVDQLPVGKMTGWEQSTLMEESVRLSMVLYSKPGEWQSLIRMLMQLAYGFDGRCLVLVRT